MTRSGFLFLALTTLPLVCAANSLYKCADPAGHTTYTTLRETGRGWKCTLLSQDSGPSSSGSAPRRASAAATPTPAGFPKVTSEAQKGRDNDRRHILEQELATEQKNLDEARRVLGDQQGRRPNAAPEQLQLLRDTVALHERNLEALKREIANLK